MRQKIPTEITLETVDDEVSLTCRVSDGESSLSSTIDVQALNNRSSRSKPNSTVQAKTDMCPRMPVRRTCGEEPMNKFRNRRVSFFVDCGENDQHNVYTYPAVDPDLYAAVYVDKRDIALNRDRLKLRARKEAKKTPELIDSIICLHGVTNCKEAPRSLADEMKAIRTLSSSSTRGLEHFMTGRMCQHRHWAVDSILLAQDEIRNQPRSRMDCEIELSVLSSKLSRSPCLFARNLAKGDEWEALSSTVYSMSHVKYDGEENEGIFYDRRLAMHI